MYDSVNNVSLKEIVQVAIVAAALGRKNKKNKQKTNLKLILEPIQSANKIAGFFAKPRDGTLPTSPEDLVLHKRTGHGTTGCFLKLGLGFRGLGFRSTYGVPSAFKGTQQALGPQTIQTYSKPLHLNPSSSKL